MIIIAGTKTKIINISDDDEYIYENDDGFNDNDNSNDDECTWQ